MILVIWPADIPAVLLQAYQQDYTKNNEYVFITIDIYFKVTVSV